MPDLTGHNWRVMHSDCREAFLALPAKSVHCVVTSPPYWGGVRDYQIAPVKWADGWLGCFGNEPTVEMYVAHTLEVFEALRHALRDDGVIWWNIGDCYAAARGGTSRPAQTVAGGISGRGDEWAMRGQGDGYCASRDAKRFGIPHGQKMLVPFRVALGLQEAGWIVRQDVVWRKPSPMPESIDGVRWQRCRVKVESVPGDRTNGQQHRRPHGQDIRESEVTGWIPCPGCDKCRETDGYVLKRGSWRPTTGHEYVFQIVKHERYFCDAQAASEPVTGNSHPQRRGVSQPKLGQTNSGIKNNSDFGMRLTDTVESRNPRSVWTISSEPLSLTVHDFQHADYVDDRGIPRKRSPDCPIHGQSAQPQTEGPSGVSCDEQPTSNPSGHNGRTCGHRAQSPSGDSCPTGNCKTRTDSDSQRYAIPESTSANRTDGVSYVAQPETSWNTGGTPGQSDLSMRDSQSQACSPTATVHSSGECRSDHGDQTSSDDIASEESPCRTLNTAQAPACPDASRSIDASKTSTDATVLSEETASRSEDTGVSCDHFKCTCRESKTSHFAAFPTMLAWKCIQASTSSAGCCFLCGAQYAPVVEKGRVATRPGTDTKVDGVSEETHGNRDPQRHIAVKRTTGYRPTCKCNSANDPVPATVADPFTGSGTTLQVAVNTGRRFVGSEIAEHYLPLIEERAATPWVPKTERRAAKKRRNRDKRERLLFG